MTDPKLKQPAAKHQICPGHWNFNLYIFKYVKYFFDIRSRMDSCDVHSMHFEVFFWKMSQPVIL